MLECIEKVWIYASKYKTSDEFIWAQEQQPLNATISMFIAIGEESKKIELNLKNAILTNIDWNSVAGMRDKISHNYRGIDGDILWIIIFKDLIRLKDALIQMFHLINPPKELLVTFLDSPHYRHLRYLLDLK